jgi:spermidine synthase
MSAYFEELDYQMTPLGPISLRRRRQFKLDIDIVEVLLGEEHLMSDLFTVSEEALSHLALEKVSGKELDILIGGLGLGYTAAAALDNSAVASVTVIDYLAPVISWHQQGILPLGRRLVEDPRCKLVEANFFARAALGLGFDLSNPSHLYDCILVDIDHSPEFFLDPSHGNFYKSEGLAKLALNLREGGVFGLWSNDGADPIFVDRLQDVFSQAWAVDVVFPNPILEEECLQTIYLAIR